MNVQPVSIMPKSMVTGVQKREGKALESPPEIENRVESEAFSKELERKVDQSKMDKEPISQRTPVPDSRRSVSVQGQKSANDESKGALKEAAKEEKDSSAETKDASDSEIKSVKSESGQSRVTKKETKEERLKKFMDSLESEFQIPPARIVEAFSQLSPQELSLPADQSADRVVEKLDLDGDSAVKVKGLYGDLVQDLEKIDARTAETSSAQNKIVSVSALGLTQQRFDKVKSQRVALQKSLEQMNQSFWQPQALTPIPIIAQSEVAPKSGRQQVALDSYRDLSLAGNSALTAEGLNLPQDREFIYDPKTGEVFAPDNGLKAALMQSSDQPWRAISEEADGGEPGSDKSATVVASPLLAKNYGMEKASGIESLPKSNLNMMSGKLDNVNISPGDTTPGLLSKLSIPSGGPKGGSDFFSKGEKNPEAKRVESNAAKPTDGDDIKSLLATTLAASGELKDNSLNGPTAGQSAPAPIAGREINQDVVEKNIQTVFHQAQYLVKNGGGEMKVKMTPEGLGEIQLNVQLKDGRVQLQMIADNKDTKKMLESNLSSLRDSLSQQKITLDSVKIDSVVRTNVENQTHNNNHFNQNQDSRDTRQFWNQFQDQFGGRPQREALFEPPKVTGYAPRKSDPLPPAETSSSASSNGKSKGLNLVA